MSRQAVGRLALAGWTASLVLAVGAIVFYGLSPSAEPSSEWGSRELQVGLALAFLAYATVGALVASRRPENRVGWLLLVAALGFEIQGIAMGYAAYALVAEPGALPGGEIAAWLAWWIWVPGLTLTTTLLFLLFPDGRLLSRRWLAVAVLAAVLGTLGTVSSALETGPVDLLQAVDVENPFGVDGADDVATVTGWLLLLLAACSAISLVLRYRHLRGEERLQLKWFVAAAVLLAATVIGVFLSTDYASTTVNSAMGWAFVVALAAVPIAIGVAVFKHRLYEIDLIIRQTLVYGVLSALLAGLYFGIVLALQEVFSSFAGGSDLAIAVSTLAVAALFRPVRGRIQGIVDRRFYRQRYDATQTLEAFGARLRQEIDLDSLSAELRAVVSETMQPAHVSLWLRSGGGVVTSPVTISGRSAGNTEWR